MFSIEILLFLFCISSSSLFQSVQAVKDRVRISNAKTLSFNKGVLTNAKRLLPRQQLVCVNGRVGCKYEVNKAHCMQLGEHSRLKWDCRGDLKNGIRFGQTDITCEGYDFDSDKYILKNSCALRYTLELEDEKVKISRVKTMNFSKGLLANRRRLEESLQLRCIDDEEACSDEPSFVTCQIEAKSVLNIKQKCQAVIPSDIKFKRLNVVCERYTSDSDEFILQDSCVLEYTLDVNKVTLDNIVFYSLVAVICTMVVILLAIKFLQLNN